MLPCLAVCTRGIFQLLVIHIQDHRGISNAAPADAPLRPLLIPNPDEPSSDTEMVTINSEMRIYDYIGNLGFSISPTAFFQVLISCCCLIF